MAIPSKISPTTAIGVPGSTTNLVQVDSPVVEVRETSSVPILPNTRYLCIWFVPVGMNAGGDNGTIIVRLRWIGGITGTTINIGEHHATTSTTNDNRNFNAGPSQGFAIFTTRNQVSQGVQMFIGRSGTSPTGTVNYGVATLTMIPLSSKVEGTDYWYNEETGHIDAGVFSPDPANDLFPSRAVQASFTLPEDGDYLVMFTTSGMTMANPGDQTPSQFWAASIDGGATVEETPPIINSVPNGTSIGSRGYEDVGFHRTMFGGGGYWTRMRPSIAWYTLENLTAGAHTFEMYVGDSNGFPPIRAYGRRIAIFKASSFPRGIVQSRQTIRQDLDGLEDVYEATSLSLSIPATDGHHVVLCSAACADDIIVTATLQTRIVNDTSGVFYSPEAAHLLSTHASDSRNTYPLCSIGVADVTDVESDTNWAVQVRRTGGITGDHSFAAGEVGESVDANLIVWNLGSNPVIEDIVETPSFKIQVQSLVDYLPSGKAWQAKRIAATDSRSVLRQLMSAFAKEMLRETDAITLFKREIGPDQTTLYIDEWEHALAIPDGCFPGNGTDDERRTDILTKLASLGVQTKSDFIVLANKFNLNVTINNGVQHGTLPFTLPFILFDDVDAPRFTVVITYDVPESVKFPYTFPILFTTQALSILECLFEKLIPANCQLVFVPST